jgi:enhancing lycopene biosynthesis protein 2
MPKVGVILSGCGVFDGSEIHEAVLTLLALDRRGAEVQCMAPNKTLETVNHLTKKPDGTKRNVLEESARIARGDVLDLAQVRGADFDAFILPGGFGAAKNLCDFAASGASCDVDPEVQRVLEEARRAGRPLGFACIAPVVAARVFGRSIAPALTIGRDKQTADQIAAMGGRHEVRGVDDVAVDEENRIVSTPAYMEAKRIAEVEAGVEKMVEKVLEMAAVAV